MTPRHAFIDQRRRARDELGVERFAAKRADARPVTQHDQPQRTNAERNGLDCWRTASQRIRHRVCGNGDRVSERWCTLTGSTSRSTAPAQVMPKAHASSSPSGSDTRRDVPLRRCLFGQARRPVHRRNRRSSPSRRSHPGRQPTSSRRGDESRRRWWPRASRLQHGVPSRVAR